MDSLVNGFHNLKSGKRTVCKIPVNIFFNYLFNCLIVLVEEGAMKNGLYSIVHDGLCYASVLSKNLHFETLDK